MRCIYYLIVSCCLVCCLRAFVAFHSLYRYQHHRPATARLAMNFFNFPSSNNLKQASAEVSALKSKIINESRGTFNGVKASQDQRLIIADCVKLLEKKNKVSKISSSPLLNGTWTLIYTTNDGSSAGKLGPFIGDVEQIIDQPQKTYINRVTLANGIVDVSLSANWIEKKPTVWQVNFEDLKFQLLGFQVGKSQFSGVSGIWRTTYLDDTMRILYAIGGKNTVKENIYILIKG